MINLNKLLIRILEFINGSGGESTATAIPTAGRVAKFDASAHMNSSDMSSTDISNFVSGVYLNGSPSEYQKLLWTNPSPSSSFAAQTVSLDLSDYDEIEVICRPYATEASYFTSRVKVGNNGMIYSQTGYGNPVRIYGTQRNFTPTSTGVAFGDGLDFSASVSNVYCVPYQIYGIKYERVNPIQTEVSDYIVAQGKSGDWTYRKWNSGIAECWYTTTGTINVATTWGSMYYGSYSSVPNFPVTFTAVPVVQATAYAHNGNAWAGNNLTTLTSSNCGSILFYSATSQSSISIRINIYAIGTWK